MDNNWKEYKLCEVYEFSSGLSKKREEFGFGYEFVTFKDVFKNYFIPEQLTELVNSSEKEREKCSVKRGDLFLTRTSEKLEELGMSSVALKDYYNTTFNGFTKRLRPKYEDLILPEYAGFYFRTKKFRSEITAMSSMTTRASLNNSMMEKLSITVPSIQIQKKIASILITINKKIELNNEMNKTLEEMAQAIFKSWFVDFEPFEGEEFEESELGMIPKGWRVSTIGDEFSILGGGTPKTKVDEYWNSDDVLWATPTDLTAQNISVIDSTSKYISEAGLKNSSAKLLPKETVIMTSRATIGYCAITKKKLSTNQGFINIVCDKYLSNGFMLYWIRRNLEQIINLANGSTFKEISKGTFKGIKIIVPDKETLDKYNNIINKIIERIYNIKQQNDFLKVTRDSLLPKLISGEIRLNN